MKKNIFNARQILALIVLLLASFSIALTADHIPGKLKPFRALVIIGDQWEDSASYMVDLPKPTGEYSFSHFS
jgi:hypothetical protein